MTTTYRPHIDDPVRTSPRVAAAVGVLVDLAGYDADDAFCDLLGVAYRTHLDVVDLAAALLALTAQKPPEDSATWIVREVWGHLVQRGQQSPAPPRADGTAIRLEDTPTYPTET